MAKYKFIKYENIFDTSIVLYALENEAMKQVIDGEQFIEVTPDFERAYFVKEDSLKAIGSIIKEYND